ncbi:hypothetical protein DB347_20795 [Opitutaceae bacterium EW11]|nr:hypothetical protein DB347_20795 [Opitutaceae bacterium EW11]
MKRSTLLLLGALCACSLHAQTAALKFQQVSPETSYPVGEIPQGFTAIDPNSRVVLSENGQPVQQFPDDAVAVSSDGETLLFSDGHLYRQLDPVTDPEPPTHGDPSDPVWADTPDQRAQERRKLLDVVSDGGFVLPPNAISEGNSGGTSEHQVQERWYFPEPTGAASVGINGLSPAEAEAQWFVGDFSGGVREFEGNRDGLVDDSKTRVYIPRRRFETVETVSGQKSAARDAEQRAFAIQPSASGAEGEERLSRIVQLGDDSIVWEVSRRERDRGDGAGGFLKDDFLSSGTWPLFYQAIPFGQSSRTEIRRTDGYGVDPGAEGRASFHAQTILRSFPLEVLGLVDLGGQLTTVLPSGKRPQFVPVGGLREAAPRFERIVDTSRPVLLIPQMEALFSEETEAAGLTQYGGLYAKCLYRFTQSGPCHGSRDLSELGHGTSPVSSVEVPGLGRFTTLDLALIASSIGPEGQLLLGYSGDLPLVIHSGATFSLEPHPDGTYRLVSQRVAVISTRAPVLIRGSVSYVPGMTPVSAYPKSQQQRYGLKVVARDVAFVQSDWGGMW